MTPKSLEADDYAAVVIAYQTSPRSSGAYLVLVL